MAPELIDPDRYEIDEDIAGRPTKESDLYALAITIWEVACISYVCWPRSDTYADI
jgi:hypothetical protein